MELLNFYACSFKNVKNVWTPPPSTITASGRFPSIADTSKKSPAFDFSVYIKLSLPYNSCSISTNSSPQNEQSSAVIPSALNLSRKHPHYRSCRKFQLPDILHRRLPILSVRISLRSALQCRSVPSIQIRYHAVLRSGVNVPPHRPA